MTSVSRRAPLSTVVHSARVADQRAGGQLGVVHSAHPWLITARPHGRPQPVSAQLQRLDEHRDLVVGLRALFHEALNLLDGMNHGRVIATSE